MERSKLRTGLRNKGVQKEKKLQRKAKADELATAYAKLSTQEKIAKLDDLLGIGVGAVKQRARLLAELNG